MIISAECFRRENELSGMKTHIEEKKNAVKEDSEENNKLLKLWEKYIHRVSDNDLADDIRKRSQ